MILDLLVIGLVYNPVLIVVAEQSADGDVVIAGQGVLLLSVIPFKTIVTDGPIDDRGEIEC